VHDAEARQKDDGDEYEEQYFRNFFHDDDEYRRSNSFFQAISLSLLMSADVIKSGETVCCQISKYPIKMKKEKIALISVYNKDGIADFAKELIALGWKIISSGGTATHLMNAGIEVTDAADITGIQAILSHRVVTLHPKIHGGLLALDTPSHLAELLE